MKAPITTEEWRPIQGFPDYRVSSLGRVMSTRRGTNRELVGGRNQRGYRMVQLRRPDGSAMLRTVHRLVAEAFIGPLPDGMQTRHLDGDKDNNAASNLSYGTASQNMLDQVEHGVHNMASKTECIRGHAFTDENTRMYQGRRYCRACARARRSLRDAARAAA